MAQLLTLRHLNEMLDENMLDINAQTALNMVIGYPLTHTQSPTLHNALYQALHLNAILLAFPSPNISQLIDAIKTLNVALTAVTMPHKEMILPYLHHLSPEVKTLGAANTIIQKQGELWGYNTDVDGIEYALSGTPLTHKHVLIIGAGGAARAAGYVLNQYQANIYWLNRTPEKANSLIQVFGGQAIDHYMLRTQAIDVIINTTPLGMYPNLDQSPLPAEFFHPHQTIFDIIYTPVETTFLQEARKAGAHTISGINMFIAQGIKQIALWQDKTLLTPEIIELAHAALTPPTTLQ